MRPSNFKELHSADLPLMAKHIIRGGDPLQNEFVSEDKNVVQKIREENSAQSSCLQQIVIQLAPPTQFS